MNSKNLKIKIVYKTTILPVVLYGFETLSLTLREEYWLRASENRILRGIFGPKRDENGEWRRLHNEELHSFCISPNIVRVIKSRRLRWAGRVARMEEGRSAGKRPLGMLGMDGRTILEWILKKLYQYEELV